MNLLGTEKSYDALIYFSSLTKMLQTAPASQERPCIWLDVLLQVHPCERHPDFFIHGPSRGLQSSWPFSLKNEEDNLIQPNLSDRSVRNSVNNL